jgi:hypothetical protein
MDSLVKRNREEFMIYTWVVRTFGKRKNKARETAMHILPRSSKANETLLRSAIAPNIKLPVGPKPRAISLRLITLPRITSETWL